MSSAEILYPVCLTLIQKLTLSTRRSTTSLGVARDNLDQPVHSHILSRISVVRLKKAWVFGYQQSAKP